MRKNHFISSSETLWLKYCLPVAFLVAGGTFLWFQLPEPGTMLLGGACVLALAFLRIQRVELSMGRIKVHRLGQDIWIDFHNVVSVEIRHPFGVEAALLKLDCDTPIGRRVLFMLERRYVFRRPPLVRPTHPTLNVLRTLCSEAREKRRKAQATERSSAQGATAHPTA